MKLLSQYIQDMITSKDITTRFTFKINNTNFSSYVITRSASFNTEFGAAQGTFVLNNDQDVFGVGGIYEINIGDKIEYTCYYGNDITQFKSFYGEVRQRSKDESGTTRTITLICLDYIACLQDMDLDLIVEADKFEIIDETLTPNYLDAPNDSLAQIFNFANDAIADNPLPILTIRNQNTDVDDPMYSGFCYSSDTEIMTENGWMLLKDIVDKKLKIKVATLNPKTDKVEYHYPLDYFQYDYKGKMFEQGGKFINLLVTPNHKLWCKKQHSDKYEFMEAQKANKYIYFRKDFPYEGEDKKYFFLPSYTTFFSVVGGVKKFFGGKIQKQPDYDSSCTQKEQNIDMDKWLKFFGIWLAEGWIYKGGNKRKVYNSIHIAQSPKSYKLKKMIQLLEESGFKFSYYNRKNRSNEGYFYMGNIQVAQYLKQFDKARNKYIPKELKNLSKRQLNILLESLVIGDGTYKNFKNDKGFFYYTSSKQLANDVQEIALKCGYSANLKAIFDDKYKIYRYIILINDNKELIVNHINDRRKMIDYEGKVYCLEVPNHIVYVSRNGKGCWCGNSILYDNGQVKLGNPINAEFNYDLICRSYYHYVRGKYAEDIIKEILTQPDEYGNFLFNESSAQDLIDNHLTETFSNVKGTITDTLYPNFTPTTITLYAILTSAISEGATTINVDNTDGFPNSGEASINGDIFTWTSKTQTSLIGIPSSGENALKAHAIGNYVEYTNEYASGQVWYLSFSNVVTDLDSDDFSIDGGTFNYFDKRFGRIILTSAISTFALVTCTNDYDFCTLQASGIEINKMVFRSKEIASRLECVNKVRAYLSPNFIIRTIGDEKIWASFLSQKFVADYTLKLATSLQSLEDEDLYTRVVLYTKNKNPTNILLGGGATFVGSGESYKATATNSELAINDVNENDDYYIYSSPISGVGKIILGTIVPQIYLNDVAIDNKSHIVVGQQVTIETTTTSQTTQSGGK